MVTRCRRQCRVALRPPALRFVWYGALPPSFAASAFATIAIIATISCKLIIMVFTIIIVSVAASTCLSDHRYFTDSSTFTLVAAATPAASNQDNECAHGRVDDNYHALGTFGNVLIKNPG